MNMGAPAGNQNAEKWTLGNVEYLLFQMEELAEKEGVIYIGQALGLCNAYSQLWARLKIRFRRNEEIMHRIRVIEQLFECKIICGAMTGRFKEKFANAMLERYHKPEEVPMCNVTDEMVEAVEDEVGKLSNVMINSPERRGIIMEIYGMTAQEILEAGYLLYAGRIYPAGTPGTINEDGDWKPDKNAY